MRLSKRELKKQKEIQKLLDKDALTECEVERIYKEFDEAGVTNINDNAAFFTPLDLAYDFVLETGLDSTSDCIVLDLCAGIGVLSYAINVRYPKVKLICVECNQKFYEIGKKLLPNTDWYCGSVDDPKIIEEITSKYPNITYAISNPPYGVVHTMKDVKPPNYTGSVAEYKIMDIASLYNVEFGIFLIPQQSSPFKISGSPLGYTKQHVGKLEKFKKETGYEISAGFGLDTTCYTKFKHTPIIAEQVTIDY